MSKAMCFAVIVASMSVVSCNSDGVNILNSTDAVESNEVLKELSAFNDSLINSMNETTRVSRFNQALTTVTADVVGGWAMGKICIGLGKYFGPQVASQAGGVGFVVGAVYASVSINMTRAVSKEINEKAIIGAYVTMLNEKVDVENNYPKTIKLNLPAEYKELQNMGAEHNIVLKNLINEKIDTTKIKSTLSKEQYNLITSKEYTRALDQTISNVNEACLTKGGMKVEESDVPSRIMNLFFQIAEQYPQSTYDMQYIINKYIETIENGNAFTEEDKSLIYASLGVAASSYEFWVEQGIIK